MKKFFTITLVSVILFSCQKEYSYEGDPNNFGVSTGTLKDSTGNCQRILVNGIYSMDSLLNSTNFLTAQINFTSTGKWLVYSDTVNGVWFIDSGYTVLTGNQTINIRGYGSPILPIDANVTLFYQSSSCKLVCNCRGSGSATGRSSDYFPTTSNSTWTYYNSTLGDTLTITVDRFDKTFAGIDYKQFVLFIPATNSKDTLYYRKDGAGNYNRYYSIGTGPRTDFIFLKDNVPVNSKWQSPTLTLTVGGIPTQARLEFTILSKDITATIGTNSIDSIITVKEELQYFIAGNFTTVNTNEHSFAKKIGQVDFKQVNIISPLLVSVRRWLVF